MRTGVCQLCFNTKPLIEAHVYSKHLYNPLKDEKGRIVKITIKDDKTETRLYEQDGIKDPEILCQSCDNLLSKNYEHYFANMYYSGAQNSGVVKYERFQKAVNIDYQKFSKYLLTQLWRMSISKIECFDGVNLGNQHTEIIRKILYYNTPIKHNLYPIHIRILKNRMIKNHLMPAERDRYNGMNFYYFKVHQYVYYISVNSPNFKYPEAISKHFIREDDIRIYNASATTEKNIFEWILHAHK